MPTLIEMWFTKNIEDAEMDIENMPILAIDRRGNYSVFGFVGAQEDEFVRCTLTKHAEFLTRFRKKIAKE